MACLTFFVSLSAPFLKINFLDSPGGGDDGQAGQRGHNNASGGGELLRVVGRRLLLAADVPRRAFVQRIKDGPSAPSRRTGERRTGE